MERKIAKYITVLDSEAQEVFQYEIGKKDWNPDSESCEAFLVSKGHRLSNCQWMVHSEKHNLIQDWWDE